ncbi:MAG: MopE-related protein [Polyangia bacterium]|jgi:MYXO-CTERM domain-containing protein|nr:MopE-related protein [Polyangia bacterium]
MLRKETAFLTALVAIWSLGASSARAADFYFEKCEAEVERYSVRLRARVCNREADSVSVPVRFYIEPATATAPSGSPVASHTVTPGSPGCSEFVLPSSPLDPYFVLPNGKYKLWCRADYATDTAPADNLKGPSQFVVGPDLWVYSFWITKEGDQVNYYAVVCNTGTDTARNFRVGFYYDRASPPTDGDFSDSFKSLTELRPAFYYWGYNNFAPWLCQKVEIKRTSTPNGRYRSYVKVDEGLFVDEGDENNNWKGPYNFTMANPDLVIEKFTARVSSSKPYTMYWDLRICNRGTATAGTFWADVYWDQSEEDPPRLGQPGDDNHGWRSLPPNACVDHTFERHNVPESTASHPEYETWLQVDADEFVFDPDRSTNLEGPLDVRVPGGMVSGCEDSDGDGFGVGERCTTQQDCNDNDPSIHHGAQEICNDGIDQNCNGTPDDGCEGVDCADQDGDGWPSGPSCVIQDCDDADPTRSPGFGEICGDGIDQDCDGIPDDCCPGSDCCDADNDGFGVGPGCPGGVQDCDDANPAAHSTGSPELCGDNQDNDCDGLVDEDCPGTYCVDNDGDGYGVGVGCNGIQDPDDNDPNVPSANELCGDGIDNNANGVIDEGCPGCIDYDGDSYGVGDDCLPGQRDCDESDLSIHPGAAEVCDLVDNNCNYTIDEGTPGNPCPDPRCVIACAGDAACIAACPDLNCIDNDGDGWGSGSACTVEDCDDADPNMHPGAAEVCDLLDNDCDGTPDDGTPSSPCPNVQCVIACAGNQACIDACPIQDCIDHDGDGWGVGADCVESDPDDNDPSVFPGAPEICGDGKDQSGDGVVDEGCVLCVDHDGDGYGVGPYCDVRDCNDDDPSVHPGAVETCGTKDLNCDGILPAKRECESCSCSHDGGSPLAHWPTATFMVLLLGALMARRSRSRRSPRP